VLIVNPNFTIDRTIRLDALVPGSVQRTADALTALGGKGVNVARVGRVLGQRCSLVGFWPSESAATLRQLATNEDAEVFGIDVAGVVRTSSILLEASGRVTVLNEPGPVVLGADWDRLLAKVAGLAPADKTVVCSGSLPPGSPPDSYARVVELAHRLGLRAVVDTSMPQALALAVHAGADVVSPNLAEAETLLLGPSPEGVEPAGENIVGRSTQAACALVEQGAKSAIVSAGSHGAAFSGAEGSGFRPAPAVSVLNPIGAGDALVGGLVHALEQGADWSDALDFALAVASASCEQDLAGGVELARVKDLASAVPAPTPTPTPAGP